MDNTNIELLRIAVNHLGTLSDELVFVGGCTTGLLITDLGAAEIRATDDVDSIVEATSYVEYLNFSEKLQKAKFVPDTRPEAPLCRWLKGSTVLDVMPLEEGVLGFTNIWYKSAIQSPMDYEITPGIFIKVITAPYFCATKLEAFKGRGNGDYMGSHDLEDLVAVIDGREELIEEIRQAPEDVRLYIATYTKSLLASREFHDALPGYLLPDESSQQRLALLLKRLNQIADLD